MTENSETPGNSESNEPENTDHTGIRFALQTPEGTRVVDAEDLPPELRSLLAEHLRTAEMPDEIRAAVAKALGVDLSDFPVTRDQSHVHVESADAAAGASTAPHGPHGPECTCADIHRTQVWNLLDTAFPGDPHLWQAAAALFKLSAVNPVAVNNRIRLSALEDARLHIRQSVVLTGPALGPQEQLIADFREQLNL